MVWMGLHPRGAIRVFRLAAMAGLAGLWLGTAWAQDFLPGLEDLPLPRGLSAVEGAALAFDSPAGRIVEAYAAGETSRADVVAFYRATLDALGWEAADATGFVREGERLELDFFGKDGALTVRFTVRPR